MKAVKLLLFMVGFAVAVLCATPANADTHVCVGGYRDPQSAMFSGAKAEQGYPCDVSLEWPAGMGLPGDSTNVQGSLDVGVPNAVDAYYRAGGGQGKKVVMEGHSLGDFVVSQAGDAIRIQNGGVIPPNLHVITNGNAYGDSGIANDPGFGGQIFNVAAPFLGMPQDIPQMGVNRTGINDIWGNSADQWPQTQIAQVASVGQNHFPPNPVDKHETYITQGVAGPVVNEIYGVGENPVTAAANVNGTPIPPPVDAFFDGFFPVHDPAVVARSSEPSFVGELPCPGGYFTAGNAPC